MEIPQEKVKTGRPTTYDPKYIAEVDLYLETCQDTWEEFHKTRGGKSDTYERTLNVKLPSYEGFRHFLGGVPEQTMTDWAKAHPDFQSAILRIKDAQKRRLMEKGVAGTYNSTIAKLILSSNHGMAEKSEHEVHVNLPTPILDVSEDNSNEEDTSAA